ncbi:MAG: hypothetical protein DMF85_21245 [Acidobacteria bacterium]|nr:MAG: hypothetical protein DMF85_21245 [Acidobacteriota bacterium]
MTVPPATAPLAAPPAPASRSAAAATAPPAPPGVTPPPRRPQPPPPASGGFDWEGLVGVQLFSAIAGIALLIAAVFFLRYSVEHGWLQPPVRAAIGLFVGVSLLVVCELKAARQYDVTANAIGASAIAILFATFFAAHALWNLIPAGVAFGMLAIVTAVAVLLSIRRASLFIAVLGLLGGFATPVLLSTGENRPIPLFAYLLLLNIGLAWVAYRQRWAALTWLTLILTTIYQWGWVFTFLAEGQLPLAMGIFAVFPIVSVAALMVARGGARTSGASKPRERSGDSAGPASERVGEFEGRSPSMMFERTALAGAVLPLLFAVYVAVVPAYGGHAWLLLSFLLLLDLGLIATAIARRADLLYGAAALATLSVMVALVGGSYTHAARYPVVIFTAVYVLVFLRAPAVAEWFDRPFDGAGASAEYTASILLFVFAALPRIEPAFAQPWIPFATLIALLIAIAWRAAASEQGALYFLAAFFAIAAQATWSVTYLDAARLGTAVAIYSAFGLVSLSVPLLARRAGRPLEPAAGSGLVLLASLPLLLFLAAGSVAPQAIWALALLLAILNAGVFLESAGGGLPVVSFAGTIFSWAILATWWMRAASSVGVIPSLAVVAGMTLVTLGGYAWAQRQSAPAAGGTEPGFRDGLYLGLIGHLFLLFVTMNPEWGIPPWPLFGTLAVLTLCASTVALVTRADALHVAAVIATAVIVTVWAAAGGSPWATVALIASAAPSVFAIAWIFVAGSAGSAPRAAGAARDGQPRGVAPARVAAAAALFISEITAMVAASPAAPPFVPIVALHVVNLSVLLAIAWRARWEYVAVAASLVAWGAATHWQLVHLHDQPWMQLLWLVLAMYAVFIAYPVVLGDGGRDERVLTSPRTASSPSTGRGPYLAAVAASVMAFFGARAALEAGGFGWAIGAVPLVESAILAGLLRELLAIEAPGQRDLGRLALVAGAALAFVTVAIPLQLEHQWITIGWALEGAALAWLYRRIPHRGLLYAGVALIAAVFARLALNPEILYYEPRGALRIVNWYLYTYVVCAAALMMAARWYGSTRDDVMGGLVRGSRFGAIGAGILLFLLLNIEIADFYATGPTIVFRFGTDVAQDLTYTIGWLGFGMALLGIGIWLRSYGTRIAALILIAVTTFKCFLYDLASLGGLYRVASFVGLAISLALVSLALQKFVLARPKSPA